MVHAKRFRLALAAIFAWSALMQQPANAAAQPPEMQMAQQLRGALATQRATRERLRVLGGGSRCSEARFVAYRRSDREREIVDQWYVASQLWADAYLIAALRESTPVLASLRGGPGAARAGLEWDEREARCHLDKGFVFMELLWDDGEGGYYPRSNLSGSKVSRATQFADDNAVAGLALLAAAEAFPDRFWRDYYVHAAVEEAQYLAEGGLWDDTFGGGFWWNTGRGDSEEGKPAQSNALAALFFARLHAATGVPAYREWALAILGWMDSTLFDPERNLYRWSVRYEQPVARAGAGVLSPRYFNYDQGIAVEAQLAAAKLDGDQARVARAKAIGESLHMHFWNRDRGGYNLEAGVEQVFASYAAWTSLGHLALFGLERDERWLQMAQANAGALAAALHEPDGGYAYRHYRCADPRAPGCGGNVRLAVDRTRDGAAQAWMQHLQTALARTLGDGRR